MRRRDTSLTIALCASLVLHGLILRYVAERWVRDVGGNFRLESLVRLTHPAANDARPDEPNPLFHAMSSAMGEADGVGIGSNALEGDEDQRARQAEEDQAFLSRDPVGAGKVGDDPSPETRAPGEGGRGGTAGALAAREPETPVPFGPPAATAPPMPASRHTPPGAAQPVPQLGAGQKVVTAAPPSAAPPEEPAPPTPRPDDDTAIADASMAMPPMNVAHQNAPARPPSPDPGDGRLPGSNHPAADPAAMSDSESDPFASSASVEFRNGRLVARKGRKIKTTRPRISFPGQVDAYLAGGATVLLKVSIDANGKVTSVEISKSSGSNQIDQPCRVALYDWSFEPTRDARGNSIPDVLPVAISIR